MVTDPRKHYEVPPDYEATRTDRTRLSKRFTKLHMQEQKLMQEAIDRGIMKPLSEWDLEELARGKPRNQYGNFAGKAPAWLTPHVVQEIRRRFLENTYGELASHVNAAIQTLVKLMTDTSTTADGDPIVSPSLKLQAAKYIIDQTMGKAPQTVELTGLDPSLQNGRTITLLEEAKKKMEADRRTIEAEAYEVEDD